MSTARSSHGWQMRLPPSLHTMTPPNKMSHSASESFPTQQSGQLKGAGTQDDSYALHRGQMAPDGATDAVIMGCTVTWELGGESDSWRRGGGGVAEEVK